MAASHGNRDDESRRTMNECVARRLEIRRAMSTVFSVIHRLTPGIDPSESPLGATWGQDCWIAASRAGRL